MLSKKDLSSDERETVRRSRKPTTVNGEVQTNEEAQVYVHDLDLPVTVQILDDTSAVRSLGKRCEEHGYSCEWASGQKPHLTKQGKKIQGKTDNVVPLVFPGFSSNSGTSSSSESTSQDSSSSSPAAERRDEPAPRNWSDSAGVQHSCTRKHTTSQARHDYRRTLRPNQTPTGLAL